jgi:rod shape-determining protein MreD
VTFLKVGAGLVVALALQTTMAGLAIQGTGALDLVLIVVVYVALTSGPVVGLTAGCVAGLMQDSLSTGVLGIDGLAKTIVGFVVGVFGAQFIVTAPLPRFIVFVLATVLHAVVFMGVYVLLGLRQFSSPYSTVSWQALANGLVGVLVVHLVELLPGVVQRRRAHRPLKR